MEHHTEDSGNWKYGQFIEDINAPSPNNLKQYMEDSFQELMKNHKFKGSTSAKKIRNNLKKYATNSSQNHKISRNSANRYTAKSVSTLP